MRKYATLAIAIALLAACSRQAPIYNIVNRPMPPGVSELSDQEIEATIIAAAAERGWIVERVDQNRLRGTLNLRKHVAIVDIPYSSDAFSIRYVGSTNLMYERGSIHRKYNQWVINLENDIAQALRFRIIGES